jgi:hypothetical protein
VEVHIGTGRLFYRVGQVDFANQTIAWGQSTQYDTGGPGAIALDNNGNAVEVHAGTGRLFYRVGQVDVANQTIAWGQSTQYDFGGPGAVEFNINVDNAIALDNSGNTVDVHIFVDVIQQDPGNPDSDVPAPPVLQYRVGQVDFANQTIAWGQSTQYDAGGLGAIALDNNGNAVEVHVGTGRLFYRIG